MIKKIFGLSLFIILLFLVNCDNEPYEGDIIIEDNSCAIAIEVTASAAEDFANSTQDNYNLLCQAYKDALEDQIEVCGDPDGVLQVLIDNLGDCISDNLCNEAILATEIAENNYDNASDDDFEALCNAYKAAIEYQIEVCGDDGTLQAIINGLGNCEINEVPTVGVWKLSSSVSNNARDLNNDGIATSIYLMEIDCYDNEFITFYDDNTGMFSNSSYAIITYASAAVANIDNLDYFVTCIELDEVEIKEFTWIQDGNNIIVTLIENEENIYFSKDDDFLSTLIEDGFSATNAINSSLMIVEDITYYYLKQ